MLQSFNRKLSPLDWCYQELYSDTKRLSVAKPLMQLHLIELFDLGNRYHSRLCQCSTAPTGPGKGKEPPMRPGLKAGVQLLKN